MRSFLFIFSLICFLVLASGQQIGTETPEAHPPLTTYQCTSSGCTAQSQSVVIDANWRWLHNVGGYTNCFTGGVWNPLYCPDPITCATKCALEGATYSTTYGITTSGSALNMQFVTAGNIGSRVYLMNGANSYQMFKLLNREFSFDVDASQLPCGMNGAIYLVEMDQLGGTQYSTNKAGAAYGTGYCDAQCPQDIKFIDGQANMLNWNGATGQFGSCCAEMDLWEANSMSAAYTLHPCESTGLYRCNGTECTGYGNSNNSPCDRSGCDFNAYRQGVTNFYGPGLTVDSTKPFTVVTQFITDDGTDTGNLAEVRRMYVQNGKVIPNPDSICTGLGPYDSITAEYCANQLPLFGDTGNAFENTGGITGMGQALARGMVLVLSIWDDPASNMVWLDGSTGSNPGGARGPCTNSPDCRTKVPTPTVAYSNIKWGTIGSTTGQTTPPPATTTTTTTSPPTTTTTTTKPPTTTTTTTKPPTTTTTTTNPPTTTTTTPPPTTTTTTQPPQTTTTTTPPPQTTTTTTQPPQTTTTTTQPPQTTTTTTQPPQTTTTTTKPPKSNHKATTTTTTSPPTTTTTTAPPQTTTTTTQPPVTNSGSFISGCLAQVSITQTQTAAWTSGDFQFTQWEATITTGSQPLYNVYLQITPSGGATLLDYWMINQEPNTQLFTLANYHYQNGALPPYTSVSFGYQVMSGEQANIEIVNNPCAQPAVSDSSSDDNAKSCSVTVTTSVQATYNTDQQTFVQYTLSFSNQDTTSVDYANIVITPNSGSTIDSFYTMTQVSTTTDGSGVAFKVPLWGLQSGGSRTSGGFTIASPLGVTGDATVTVASSLCSTR